MTDLPVLAPLRETPLAPIAERLCLPDANPTAAGGAMPASDLCDGRVVQRLMQHFHTAGWKTAPRATLSLWSQYYFKQLLPPVLIAHLIYDHALPLTLSEVAVVIDDDRLPQRFVLPHEGATGGSKAGLHSLETDHIAPLIAAWSRQSRLAPRVYWANLARFLDWIADEMTSHGHAGAASRVREWQQALDGGRPAHRRPCCLRDSLPGIVTCADCPKHKETARV